MQHLLENSPSQDLLTLNDDGTFTIPSLELDEFGAFLQKLLYFAPLESQVAALHDIQQLCYDICFPYREYMCCAALVRLADCCHSGLFEALCFTLYTSQILPEEAFLAWKMAPIETAQGKLQALYEVSTA